MLTRTHWQRQIARLDPERDYEEIYAIIGHPRVPLGHEPVALVRPLPDLRGPSIGRLLDETGRVRARHPGRYDDTALLLDEPDGTACTARADVARSGGSTRCTAPTTIATTTCATCWPRSWCRSAGWTTTAGGRSAPRRCGPACATTSELGRLMGIRDVPGHLRRLRVAARRLRGRALRLRRRRAPGRGRHDAADADVLPVGRCAVRWRCSAGRSWTTRCSRPSTTAGPRRAVVPRPGRGCAPGVGSRRSLPARRTARPRPRHAPDPVLPGRLRRGRARHLPPRLPGRPVPRRRR